jgi:CHAT domain-containing protein
VLLEEYTLGVVPHGQFLLEQLTAGPSAADDRGLFLAVGNLDYDHRPQPATRKPDRVVLRGPALRGGRPHWPSLPATKNELDVLADDSAADSVLRLEGGDASPSRVLAELPRARWAHFATHGFFADPGFRSALQPGPAASREPSLQIGSTHATFVARNPLVLSGLVLSGANSPRPRDDFGIPHGDGGILTAEAIAALPLERLDLVVLSACETGLGRVAGGEGVFGLQRAFHSAGARNVVASLWKVDDEATAALMRILYHCYRVQKCSPMQALRRAQLFLYRHPEHFEELGNVSRGSIVLVAERIKRLDLQKPPSSPAATRHWAAFVLSGAGRIPD